MCFGWISEYTAIISLYSINLSVFISEADSVYCAVQTGSLNQAAIVLPLKVKLTQIQSRAGLLRRDTGRVISWPQKQLRASQGLYGGAVYSEEQRGLLPLLYTRILSATRTFITSTPIICQLRCSMLWHLYHATLACKQSETCKARLSAYLALKARLILVRV
jgi:hypothetical protein